MTRRPSFASGDKIGVFTVTGNTRRNKVNIEYELLCDCGHTRWALAGRINNGTLRSCGHVECPYAVHELHGKTSMNEKYVSGKKKVTKEYRAWVNLNNRCNNIFDANYKDYGGKGVKVHSPWIKSFYQFNQDMGDAPSQEHRFVRIDKDGDFEPGNCEWRINKKKKRRKCSIVTFIDNGFDRPTFVLPTLLYKIFSVCWLKTFFI